jgi:hypothetical protein
MSRNLELKTKRNDKIKAEYAKLSKETIGTKNPVPKYRHIAILAILSDKFYLKPDYIQNIISTQ